MSCVKIGWNPLDRYNNYIFRQESIQTLQQLRELYFFRDIERDYLPSGVYSGVGSPGRCRHRGLLQYLAKSLFKLRLD